MVWKKPTKAQARRRSKRRRSRILKGSLNNTPEDNKIIAVIYETCRRITKCMGLPFHVDHIYPISRGGKHHPSNLQILPAKLNLKKKSKIPKKAKSK
jgi:5-methylcytosine-specific restriction endonuclease McrA